MSSLSGTRHPGASSSLVEGCCVQLRRGRLVRRLLITPYEGPPGFSSLGERLGHLPDGHYEGTTVGFEHVKEGLWCGGHGCV